MNVGIGAAYPAQSLSNWVSLHCLAGHNTSGFFACVSMAKVSGGSESQSQFVMLGHKFTFKGFDLACSRPHLWAFPPTGACIVVALHILDGNAEAAHSCITTASCGAAGVLGEDTSDAEAEAAWRARCCQVGSPLDMCSHESPIRMSW